MRKFMAIAMVLLASAVHAETLLLQTSVSMSGLAGASAPPAPMNVQFRMGYGFPMQVDVRPEMHQGDIIEVPSEQLTALNPVLQVWPYGGWELGMSSGYVPGSVDALWESGPFRTTNTFVPKIGEGFYGYNLTKIELELTSHGRHVEQGAHQYVTASGTTQIRFYGEYGGIQGDHNKDGTVDAADYVMWRKNDPFYDDFNLRWPGHDTWRNGYGNNVPPGVVELGVGSVAVPEPSTVVLALCGMVAMMRRRVHKRTRSPRPSFPSAWIIPEHNE